MDETRNYGLRRRVPSSWCGIHRVSWIVQAITGLAFVVIVSCGGPAHEYDAVVTGTVTIDGELAKSGIVTFLPIKNGLPAIGRIYADGSYSLRTGQGDLRKSDGGTVIPGEYLVTVAITAPPAAGAVVGEHGPSVAGPTLIAKKYALKDTTDLRFTVKPGQNMFVLELAAAEPGPSGGTVPDAASPANPQSESAASGATSERPNSVEAPTNAGERTAQ